MAKRQANNTRTPGYFTWKNMRQRCSNPNHPRFADWGGRGITVCERWQSFTNFIADMGVKPDGMSIERKDNDGNYCPGNCVWATVAQQNNNQRTRRDQVLLGGKTVKQLVKETGLADLTIRNRIRLGWSLERLTA